MIDLIPWWGFALYVSVMGAVSNDVNARAKLDGLTLKATNGLFAGLLLTPSLFFVPLPSASEFYIAMVISAFLLSFFEVGSLNMTAAYGGAFTSLLRPIHIPLAFILWSVLFFESSKEMFSSTFTIIGIITSFALLILSKTIFLKKSDKGLKKGFLILILLGCLGAIITVSTKLGISFTETSWQVLVWSCLLNYTISSMAIVRILTSSKRKLRDSLKPKFLKVSFTLGFFTAIIAPVTTLAILTAPNPSFPTAIFMLTTVWLAGYYKLAGRPTNLHPLAAALLILSALILIFSTAGLS